MLKNYDNIFLDRDGIINEVIIRGTEVSSPRNFNEFKFRSEIREFVKELHNQRKRIFIVSNQPDIARGKLSKKDLGDMTKLIKKELKITEISYCTHDDKDGCNCRKPQPGLITNYIKKYKLSESKSVMIGDSIKDMKAAQNAGIKSILLKTEHNKSIKNSIEYVHIFQLLELL
tara:strand:+ start:127 stop:645 length:519 start_codon:yes stop_codon:yes gene_type:complete